MQGLVSMCHSLKGNLEKCFLALVNTNNHLLNVGSLKYVNIYLTFIQMYAGHGEKESYALTCHFKM